MTLRTSIPALLGLAALWCGPAPADPADPPPAFPKFQAKTVRPPAPGTKRRITVQIEPPPPAPPQVATQKGDPPPGAEPAEPDPVVPGGVADSPGRYAWFWERVPPQIEFTGPGRLEAALRALSGTHEVAAPRLQTLQDIARTRGRPILKSTIGTGVSPALVLAVIAVESAGREDAVSHAGAQGLMQLMPATANRFGVSDSLKAEENIQGGVKYLDWLLKEFGGDPVLALAGYNAGEGAVRKHAGVPPYAETRDYVPKVLAAFQVARNLCRTPPELVSDGCVFTAMN